MAKTPWGEKMRGLMEFIEAHTVNLWKRRANREWIVYKGVNQRFRIACERQHSLYEDPEAYAEKGIDQDVDGLDFCRDDYFAEKYHHPVYEEDMRFFAEQLRDTLFQETSYACRRYIIAVLMEMQEELHKAWKSDKGEPGYIHVEPDPIATPEEMNGPLAQLVERLPEEECVGGLTPSGATK